MAYGTVTQLVTGDMVTTAYKTTVYNNMVVWNTHTHGGTTGHGATALSSVATTPFTDISDPTAPASGKLIIYSSSGVLKFRQSSGTVKTLATTDHTH